MTSKPCDICGKESPVDSINRDCLEEGVILTFDGYYGSFYDSIDETPWALLCHDCTAELWRKIPKFEKYGKSFHRNSPYYCTQEEPCCEFSS